MAKWDVFGKVTGSKYLGQFEADTEEQAIELAAKQASASFCHQCSGECEDPEVDDLTAEPAFIERED